MAAQLGPRCATWDKIQDLYVRRSREAAAPTAREVADGLYTSGGHRMTELASDLKIDCPSIDSQNEAAGSDHALRTAQYVLPMRGPCARPCGPKAQCGAYAKDF